MTQTTTTGRRIARFLFMALGGFVLVAVASAFRAEPVEDDDFEPVDGDWDPGAPERQPVHIPRPPRKFWTTLTMTLCS